MHSNLVCDCVQRISTLQQKVLSLRQQWAEGGDAGDADEETRARAEREWWEGSGGDKFNQLEHQMQEMRASLQALEQQQHDALRHTDKPEGSVSAGADQAVGVGVLRGDDDEMQQLRHEQELMREEINTLKTALKQVLESSRADSSGEQAGEVQSEERDRAEDRSGRGKRRESKRTLASALRKKSDDHGREGKAPGRPHVHIHCHAGQQVVYSDEGITWLPVAHNAYGAFIHVALSRGFPRALIMCFPMVFLSVAIQYVFSTQLLLGHLNDFEEYGDGICSVAWILHIFGAMIFTILMFNNLPHMMQAAKIAVNSTHFKGDGEETIVINVAADEDEEAETQVHGTPMAPIHRTLCYRLLVLFFGVVSEMVTWGLILTAGIVWIVTAPSTDIVIRSTVAIMFVLNVDEVVYDACCSPKIRSDVEATRYRVPQLMHRVGLSHKRDLLYHWFGVYIYIPLLSIITVSLVLSMRSFLRFYFSTVFQLSYTEVPACASLKSTSIYLHIREICLTHQHIDESVPQERALL